MQPENRIKTFSLRSISKNYLYTTVRLSVKGANNSSVINHKKIKYVGYNV